MMSTSGPQSTDRVHPLASEPFTVPTDSETATRLDTLAARLDRPQNDPVDQANKEVHDLHAWRIHKIQEGIEAADRGQTIPHEDVMAKMDTLIEEQIEWHESRQSPTAAI